MGILSKIRVQTAVYWGTHGTIPASEYGKPAYASPVQITCRWIDKSERFVDTTGTERVSRAKVFVDQDVVVGGLLMLGTTSDITDSNNPRNNTGAWEIQSVLKAPFPVTKLKDYVRIAYLA